MSLDEHYASPAVRFWRAIKPKLLGLGFFIVIGALIGLTILIYNKAFTKVVKVSFPTDRIGNQLDLNADVKYHGIVVGEVRGIRSTGTGAVLTLALSPDKARTIPDTVEGRILPKTLFGEKFVDLVGTTTTGTALKAGDVVKQDTSAAAIELSKVFDDVVPVLTAVNPAELQTTLTTVATALQGRSDELGQNITLADQYFQKLNPALPQLDTDISGLADLADTYSAAAPDLLNLLANQSFTSDTLHQKFSEIADLLRGTRGFTDDLAALLQHNEQNLIQLGAVSRPVLDVLRAQGEQIPYIFHGLVQLAPRIDAALGGSGPWLHIKAQIAPDRGAYTAAADCPNYANEAKGPNCPGYVAPKASTGEKTSYTGKWVDPTGTADEASYINTMVGFTNGNTSPRTEGLSDLLYGPLLRGTQVSLS